MKPQRAALHQPCSAYAAAFIAGSLVATLLLSAVPAGIEVRASRAQPDPRGRAARTTPTTALPSLTPPAAQHLRQARVQKHPPACTSSHAGVLGPAGVERGGAAQRSAV